MEETAKDITAKFDINLVLAISSKALEEIKDHKRCGQCGSDDIRYERKEAIVGVDYNRTCKKCGNQVHHWNDNYVPGVPILFRY